MKLNYKDKSINVVGKDEINKRLDAYHNDEPKTIRWIENFNPNGIFYDIGSNIGGFSFIAKMIHQNMTIFSFEPNFMNYMVQIQTIKKNNLIGINSLNVAINDCDSYDFFYYESNKEGSKGNFGDVLKSNLKKSKWGNPFKKGVNFQLPIMGMSIDSLIKRFDLPCPNYLKIDVDGNERLVVGGMIEVLKNQELKEIMIEVDEVVNQDGQIYDIIESNGFTETQDIYWGKGMRMKLYVR